MICKRCGGVAHDNPWGSWCDPCGGVPHPTGDGLIFRHVATVEGAGGRFPIVWDMTTGDYAFMHKAENPPSAKRDMDGFRKPRVRVSHGTLDAVIALAYTDCKGGGDDNDLRVSVAPSANLAEKILILHESI